MAGDGWRDVLTLGDLNVIDDLSPEVRAAVDRYAASGLVERPEPEGSPLTEAYHRGYEAGFTEGTQTVEEEVERAMHVNHSPPPRDQREPDDVPEPKVGVSA